MVVTDIAAERDLVGPLQRERPGRVHRDVLEHGLVRGPGIGFVLVGVHPQEEPARVLTERRASFVARYVRLRARDVVELLPVSRRQDAQFFYVRAGWWGGPSGRSPVGRGEGWPNRRGATTAGGDHQE